MNDNLGTPKIKEEPDHDHCDPFSKEKVEHI